MNLSEKKLKELSGHSGCRLCLYQKNEKYFVRKDAGNVSYNRRLKKQFIKQKYFTLSDIKTPAILAYGVKDGIFFFDMEYVQGATLANIFKNIQLNEIEHLIELLFNSLLINQGQYRNNTASIFKKKISEIGNNILRKTNIISESLNLLFSYDFNQVPYSYCCGDLTLENIILTPSGQIYLIDLLDSFYNSWMIDVAKLLQNLELGWSYRYEKRNFNLNLRLNTAKNILLTRLSSLSQGHKYIESIYILLLLNTLRIVPYIKDHVTELFINEALHKIINIIKELREE